MYCIANNCSEDSRNLAKNIKVDPVTHILNLDTANYAQGKKIVNFYFGVTDNGTMKKTVGYIPGFVQWLP